VRVGINGMGRIGRTFWRVSLARPDIDVVAVNDIAPAESLAYLMTYDSVRGRSPVRVEASGVQVSSVGVSGVEAGRGAVCGGELRVDGQRLPVFRSERPDQIPWADAGVDLVLEATGRFFAAADLKRHQAHRVLVSTATADVDATVLMGINEDAVDPARHRILSPGCCTSSAIAPILAVLRELGPIEGGTMTTVHAYDSTKSALLDSVHTNPRMGRAAAANLIPAPFKPASLGTLTGAFPELTGLLEGMHVRVPAIIGCLADIVVRMPGAPAANVVNAALSAAAGGHFKGVLGYTEDDIVSSDIVGAAESSIVDGQFTSVAGGCVRVIAWYDNEWGFAHRLADVAGLLG
jgi:glyceraldehyde 3-phosphate dehydrogenase